MEKELSVQHWDETSYLRKGKEVARSSSPDYINGLSDDTLRCILSFLSTREATRTSILSKRWKNLWRFTGTIDFDVDEIMGITPHLKIEPFASQHIEEFVKLVDQFFESYLGFDIRTCRLHLCSKKDHYQHIDRWVSLATKMHVQNLDLNFDGATSRYNFSCDLLCGDGQSRLKFLSLNYCLLNPSANIDGFSSLTTLTLENVTLPNNFHEFISCSPFLEKLSIQDCGGLRDLKIASPQSHLKYLKVVNSAQRVDIYAWNLVTLECSLFKEVFFYLNIDKNGNFDPLSYDMVYPRCIMAPDPCFGGFKHLTVLAIRFANFTAKPLHHLLAGCSSLKELTLEECDMPSDTSTLEISQLISLESLKVSRCRGLKKIRTSATKLKKFVFISESVGCFPQDTFELLDDDGNKFSSALGKGSSLKHLELEGCKFSIDLPCFTSLETVILSEIQLEEEDIMDLLRNCSLLQSLSIVKCCGFLALTIVGPLLQLRELIISRCSDLKEVEICAANLIELEYHGPMVLFSLGEVPQLATVEMEIEADDETTVTQILKILSRDVPKLDTLILYIEHGDVPDKLPTFYNLKHLVLFLGQYPNELRNYTWVAALMVASPFLEKYHLQLSRYLTDARSRTTLPLTWAHHHLKEVELGRFSGSNIEMELAANLVQNAKALELMRIDGRAKHRRADKGWYAAPPPFNWVRNGRLRTREEMKKIAKGRIRLEIL